MRKVVATLGLMAVTALAFVSNASAHTLDKATAEQYAAAYAQAIVDDNDWGVYDYDVGRCRAVSMHRRDCELTVYYADEDDHSDGACDVTVTVRFYTAHSKRIKTYDRGDWVCDSEDI